jgi:hypothetical protein
MLKLLVNLSKIFIMNKYKPFKIRFIYQLCNFMFVCQKFIYHKVNSTKYNFKINKSYYYL